MRRSLVYCGILSSLLYGALTGVAAPRVGKNLPTPFAGIWERINIGVFLLWVAILALRLLRGDAVRNRVRPPVVSGSSLTM
jgi:hypothetical protein